MEWLVRIGAACVLSALVAAIVSISGRHDQPPEWVDRWFAGSILVGVAVVVIPSLVAFIVRGR